MREETQDILQSIANGDEEAFRTLFDMFFPKVKVFLAKFIKDDKAAEDLAQDIFVKLWSLGPSLPEIRSFNTYLYRMTRNAAINYLRDKRQMTDISDMPILDDCDIEQEYYRKEKELLIRLMVEQMPEQRRKIFTMSRYQGIPNDEIAKHLNISKHTVENCLSIALKELRDIIVVFVIFFMN